MLINLGTGMTSMVRNYISTAEKRREDARRTILDAAVELFFTKGYEKTTTRDIILKAGILNGSLYNRFKNKEQILYSIVEEALTDSLDQLSELLEKEGNPLQYSCLENLIDRGAQQPTVHGVTKVLDTTERLNNKYTKGMCMCVCAPHDIQAPVLRC